MNRLIIFLLFLISASTTLFSQGTWNPPGSDASFPRTLLDSSAIFSIRESLATQEILSIYRAVWQNASAPVPSGTNSDGDRMARAMIAKEVGFAVLMNRKVSGNEILTLSETERDSLIIKCKGILEQINTHVGYQEGWVFYQEWQHRSKELIGYLIAYDLLRGAGVTKEFLGTAQDSLISFTANLYRRAMATYQVLFFPLKFFEFQFNNHSIMTASALGVAAILFNDQGSADPDRQPLNWINAGMWNLDNTLWVQNPPYPRVSEPDTLSGYAEGPGYFDYAFQNGYPFMRAMGNFLSDANYPFTFGQVSRQIQNPWYDERYDLLCSWINKIRMPDGSLPALHDSPIGFGTTITALSGKPQFNLLNPTFGQENVITRTQYIAAAVMHGTITDSLFQPLPDAGSLVFRSGWDTAATYWHFIGKHGIILSGAKSHHQGDASSFSLYAHGQLLAVDPGYPGASESDAVNKPTDHNLILVNGNGPNPPNGEFVSTTTNTSFIENYFDLSHFDYGEIRTAYHGASIIRKALFLRNNYCILADFINSNTANNYTYQLHGNGIYGGSSTSISGNFTPVFSDFSAFWQRDSVRLSATILCDSEHPVYTYEMDSLATGSSSYRHYSKMLVSSGSGVLNTFFLSGLLPSDSERPVITPVINLLNGKGLRINTYNFNDFILCQKQNILTEAGPETTGFGESFSGNGLVNLMLAGATGPPAAWFLQSGDSLFYGSQPLLVADHRMDIAFEQINPDLFGGYVSDAGEVKIFSDQPLRVIEGNIGSISYSPDNKLNTVSFSANGIFRLGLSNGMEEQEEKKFLLSARPNPSHSGKFRIFVESGHAISVQLKLADAGGRVIMETDTFLKSGTNELTVDLSGYPSGEYFLSLNKGSVNGAITLIRR